VTKPSGGRQRGGEFGVLATTRVAAFVLLAVTGRVVLLSLAGALPGAAFASLMFLFNTDFPVMANSASLVIDPHREIAGFASSAYGFFRQITASAVAADGSAVQRRAAALGA
jgi:DHA1 family bicyclomycin/chloramphenicol resistance-like MFS transporter